MFTEEKASGEVMSQDAKYLLQAATLIELYGHCKGQLQDHKGRVCLVGAINWAVNNDPLDYRPDNCARLVELVGGTVFEAVAWNNAPETTGEAVIARLREVAKRV